jgi:hypothetical protein
MLTAGLVLSSLPLQAAEEGEDLPIKIINRLRVEYDDNVREEKSDQDSSVNIIEELELIFQATGEKTFFGLRYLPSFVYFTDRDEDDSDFHHQFDASLRHVFSPGLELSLTELLRYSEQPELIDNDVQVRENNDFLYNSFNAGLSSRLHERAVLDLEGRHELLSYDDNAVAESNDYDKLSAGLNLNYIVSNLSTLSLEGRYSEADYDDNIRSYSAVQGGLGLNSQIAKGVFTELRGGAEVREYDDADSIEDTEEPYVSAGVTFTPNDATRINIGAGYALAQTPTSRFVAQGRTSVNAGISHDVTGRLTANVSAAYSTGDFEENESVRSVSGPEGGTEDVARVSARLVYEVSKRNFLEASWQYVDLESEIRPELDYDRNRIALGWKSVLK